MIEITCTLIGVAGTMIAAIIGAIVKDYRERMTQLEIDVAILKALVTQSRPELAPIPAAKKKGRAGR
ncbi:MAG TPA: hypothetical protein VGF28_07720 [Thermoanaerobaculia bacterium]|jgi:hypothetical protein